MLGLRTTIYKVGDLQKAKSWYSEAFGCIPYFDEPFYVGFNISGFELGLDPNGFKPGTNADNVITYWGVNDVEAEYTHLIALGAREHEAPHNVGGAIRVASVIDPWGNVVGIIFNPEFEG